jgi:fluoride exporter
MIKQVLLVGLGGGFGSIFRYLTSVLTEKFYSGTYPLATFIANILGCFIIGLLIGIIGHHSQANQNLKLLLVTGFCGGYTTFSTFASENITLLQANHSLTAILYIGTSVIAGLLAVWLGMALTK